MKKIQSNVRTSGPAGSKSGVALMLVMMSLALMTVLAVEVIFASRVDLRIGRNARDRLQAFYLAQSSARLSLLRLSLYKEAQGLLDGGGSIPVPKEMTDRIWSMPLPPFPFDGMKTEWPGTIMASIQSEGSKIPINLLDGDPNRVYGSSTLTGLEVQKSVRDQLKKLIEGMLQQDEFDKIYHGMKVEDLLDPLQDWVAAGAQGANGRDKNGPYEGRDPPYLPRSDRIPSLSELPMIENWNDDLMRRIGPSLSTLNTATTINPNYMTLDRLRAIDPKLSEEDLQAIQRKRLLTPFGTLAELEGFINTDPAVKNGGNFHFDGFTAATHETTFVIEAIGIVGEARRTLHLGIRFFEEPVKPSTEKDPATGQPKEPKPGKLMEPLVVTVEEVL